MGNTSLWNRLVLLAVVLTAGGVTWGEGRGTCPSAVAPFAAGERVLFFGDSITQDGAYIAYLQLFENLRHPGSGVRLVNAGLSGATAETGVSSVARELADAPSERVFVMFGMNDIDRTAWSETSPSPAPAARRQRALARFETNMTALVTRLQAAGRRVVLMTPTPYDQYGHHDADNIPRCNEPGLRLAAETVRRIAQAKGCELVDLYEPMTRVFRSAAEDFDFCRDRVHPGNEGHLLVAAEILKAMGVGPEVATTEVTAEAGATTCSFEHAPEALPFPMMPEYESAEAFGYLTDRLNREILRVKGLAKGRYALTVGSARLGLYSADELSVGVNIATMPTPNQLRAQALVPVLRQFQSKVADFRGELPARRNLKTLAEIESLRNKLAAVRPVRCQVTVTRVAVRDSAVTAWETRGRREALDWFAAHQFGRTPIGRTADETFGETTVSFPELGVRINVSCHLPEGASPEHPVPVFLMGDHCDRKEFPGFVPDVYKGLPIGEITSRGYAFVRWNFNDVCPNASYWKRPELWPQGVIAAVATGDAASTNVVRAADSWGTIGAWAWGDSRVLDWIETRPELDAARVAVVGHSRGGKTALWAGAQDARFAMVVSNGSGCGGAGLAHVRVASEKSEKFGDILKHFPNWFCPAFTEWIGREAEVPHDSDDLIRLIAPRCVYVASGSDDVWACPESEKAALDAARDLYRAYGVEDRMGYHCHAGPHKLHAVDWRHFMDFADRHLKRQ